MEQIQENYSIAVLIKAAFTYEIQTRLDSLIANQNNLSNDLPNQNFQLVKEYLESRISEISNKFK
jgi:hypothetical protein